ncbi:hypothetical protein GCM10009765_54720 [Fodinicola feengrottensis]|uniref:Class I SAM-dependent methyltransferase n=1 Tax=Fodinicola feengrottensis TaxID=435914 RepID=A0ABP4U407_9ACTN
MPRKAPRLAAGRARALGVATRGTTAPNRLRRVDRWLVANHAQLLRAAADPLVVDLGYGAAPVTTVELAARLRLVRPDVRVVGLEIDPERVAAAAPAADPPALEFRRGGFECAGLRPVVIRAMNVLRQYPEEASAPAWEQLLARLAAGGLLVEGTCDELGRVGCWVALDAAGPVTLTLAARLSTLDRPATLAERLPKALIHRNVPGERIHALLATFDAAWQSAAALASYGPRQRWAAAAARLAADGWPVVDRPDRWRQGELTVRWEAVSP